MILSQLLAGYTTVTSDLVIDHLSTDSRHLSAHSVYLAIHGERYLAAAISQGATIIVYDPEQVSTHKIADLATANRILWIPIVQLSQQLGEIAARYYAHPSQQLSVIGVTGTNGKTSCSQFLAQGLNAPVIGTLGWGKIGHLIDTGYTTPDALQLQQIFAQIVANGDTTAIMEVSSHGLQEYRVQGTQFKGAIFTQLSRDHLDYHGSMAAYFAAKLRLFTDYSLEFAVINQQDHHGQKIIAALPNSVDCWQFAVNCPPSTHAQVVTADQIHCHLQGIDFTLHYQQQSIVVHSGLYGLFNVENLLACATTYLALGDDLEQVADRLQQIQPVCGRMQRFGGADLPTVFVDYAHTPDALEKALLNLRQHHPRQLIVVFGCGGDRDQGKRPLMGEIAVRCADQVIITDDNPRTETSDSIIQHILLGCRSTAVTVIPDRASAIYTAIHNATAKDCVLIAGKGHETFQLVQHQKFPFSDQAVVLAALSS